jgi:hypothetical protein
MHSPSTLVLPDSQVSDLAAEEPTLFENSILDPRASGRPWSIIDPPLATVPGSTLQETAEPSADVAADEVYEHEIFPPLAEPEVPEPRSDATREAPPLEEAYQDDRSGPIEEISQVDLDSDVRMTLHAPLPQASVADDDAASPGVATPPSTEPAKAVKVISDDPMVDDRPVGPLFASAAAPCDAPSSGAARSARPAVAPKRIGSGCLVPARLTWKPRDPFAAGGRSGMERFRWELMLTSACITAVCGLGCVWLLRTLLA